MKDLFSCRVAVPIAAEELDCLDLKRQSWILNFWQCTSSDASCLHASYECVNFFWFSEGRYYTEWQYQWNKAFSILQSSAILEMLQRMKQLPRERQYSCV